MSKFARPASWLRELFTSSRTEFRNPSDLSRDVSLTQPYDGSSWFLADSGMWYMEATSAAGASGHTNIGNVLGENVYARLLAVHVRNSVVALPTRAMVNLLMPNGTDFVNISNTGNVQSSWLISGDYNSFLLQCPIIGPGMQLRGYHSGGDGTSVMVWKALFVEVPAGSVFYI